MPLKKLNQILMTQSKLTTILYRTSCTVLLLFGFVLNGLGSGIQVIAKNELTSASQTIQSYSQVHLVNKTSSDFNCDLFCELDEEELEDQDHHFIYAFCTSFLSTLKPSIDKNQVHSYQISSQVFLPHIPFYILYRNFKNFCI